MNYDTVIKHLQTLLEVPLNQEDENWARIVPLMFAYAENRIYRELDFLATTTSTAGLLVANNREMALPVTVLVLRQLIVFAMLPDPPTAGGVHTNLRTRVTLERVSPEALDIFWPQEMWRPGVPRQYAMIGKSTPALVSGLPDLLSHTIRLAPTPDQAYEADFLGVIRPRPLSPKNPETLLSTVYPDLFCAACMVFGSGYQRDFGAMADDPGKAMSWEGTYNALKAGVMLEAARQKGEGAGPPVPTPAVQPRGA
jgi:hypothetical protein